MSNLQDIDILKLKEKKEIQNKNIEEYREFLTEQNKKDLREILNLPAGRRLIWDLIKNKCRLFDSIYLKGDPSEVVAWRDGRRNIGAIYYSLIQSIDNTFLTKMLNEEKSNSITKFKEKKNNGK